MEYDADNPRFSWELESNVSIYSRSKQQWFIGRISDIYMNTKTNKEWFIVKYAGNMRKHIQRLCPAIKPLEREENDAHDMNHHELENDQGVHQENDY